VGSTSAPQQITVWLQVSLSDFSPGTVIYSGGESGLDLLLALAGLPVPLTTGDVIGAFGDATLSFRISQLGVSTQDFLLDPGDCLTVTGASSCAYSLSFRPTMLGLRTGLLSGSAIPTQITGGGFPGALADALLPFLAPLAATRIDTTISGTGTPAITMPTTTVLSDIDPPSPSVVGQSVTLTVTVCPAGATGTVQFKDGGADLGSPQPLDAAGHAMLTTSSLAVGFHDLSAVYSGDTLFDSSISPAVLYEVTGLTVGVSFGDQPVGSTSAPRQITVWLQVSLSDFDPSTVIYSGGELGLNLLLALAGLPVPLTTGNVIAVFGDATLSFRITQLGVSSQDFLLDPGDCLTVTGASSCAFSLSFRPTMLGLRTGLLSGSAIPTQITGGGFPGALADALLPFLAPLAASRIDTTISGTGTPAITMPTTTVLSDIDPSSPAVVGQSVTLTATVSPAGATGTVQFKDGGADLGPPQPLDAAAQAMLTTSSLAVGFHGLSAVYSGDTLFSSSISAAILYEVTGLTGGASFGDQPVGSTSAPQQFTVWVQVSLSDFSPGTVIYSGGNANLDLLLAVAGLPVPLTLGDLIGAFGDATLSFRISQLGVSSQDFLLDPGDCLTIIGSSSCDFSLSFRPTMLGLRTGLLSGSAIPTQITGGGFPGALADTLLPFLAPLASTRIDTTLSGTGTPAITMPSTTVLSGIDPPSPAIVGQSVTLTATVSPADATGTVQFKDGGANLGPPQFLDAAGQAMLITSSLRGGLHSLAAEYSGDSQFLGSASSPVDYRVKRTFSAVGIIEVSPPSPALVGQQVTFTAAVVPAGATGTVQFRDGRAALGPPRPLDASGHATLAIATLTVGLHRISAVYSGDASFYWSRSTRLGYLVTRVPTVVMITGAAPSGQAEAGVPVTFTAAVSPLGATGTVQFKDGTTVLGGPQPVSAAGQAAVPTSSLAPGFHSITAVYSGDSRHRGSRSLPFLYLVTAGT